MGVSNVCRVLSVGICLNRRNENQFIGQELLQKVLEKSASCKICGVFPIMAVESIGSPSVLFVFSIGVFVFGE